MKTFHRWQRQLRTYTSGLKVLGAHRELGRDASRAYEILTREYVQEREPDGWFKRIWHRTRILFLGVSYKLTPTRRVIFVGSVVCTILGLQIVDFDRAGGVFSLIGSPLPLLIAIAGFAFLLGLELTDRVLVRDELEVARQLQRDLLPHRPPDLHGYSFAFSYRTANTIGGDYYDFLPLADGRLALVMGDASGHGIAAGLLMAIANAALKLATDLDPSPAAVADILNRTLYRTGGPRAFMTVFYGVLDPACGRLDFVTVGHPFPILRRADGELAELGAGCLPLGLRPQVAPTLQAVDLRSGDLLVLYTDGLPESVDVSGNSFGYERMRGVVAAGGRATGLHDRVWHAVDGFSSGAEVHDDRSLMIVERHA